MAVSGKQTGNMGAELDSDKEEVMDQGVEDSFEDVKDAEENDEFESPEEPSGKPLGLSVGIETEYYILDENNEPVSEEHRDLIIGKGEDSEFESIENVDHELGASMVEIASDPVKNPGSLDEIEHELESTEEDLIERIERVEEEENKEFKLVRHGANAAQDLDSIERTQEGKYIAVPNAYGEMRVEDEELEFTEDLVADRMTDEFGEIDNIDPRNEDLPAAICSTQLNMQADGIEDAVEKANTGYAVAPYITALAGNSRFIDGKDLGFNDTRMELWEKAFDIGDMEKDNLDIGKIDEYFQDLEDIKERLKEQPRIINDTEKEGIEEEYAETVEDIPLDVAEGMFWKDTRIKSTEVYETEEGKEEQVRDDLLVEFRQNSTQPTLEEDIAVHAFYIGRVVYEQEGLGEGDELLDIEKVNQNRYEAMRNGLDAELYAWDAEEDDQPIEAEEVIGDELEKAREGLNYAIGDSSHLDILDRRLEKGVTPSDEITIQYYDNLLEDHGYEATGSVKSPNELPDKLEYGDIPDEVKNAAAVEATNKISMTDSNQRLKAH